MSTTSTTATDSGTFFNKRIAAALLVSAIAGLAISIELTRIHHSTHTDASYQSVCAVSDEVNCETVARSPYSVFLGAPVSVWGMFGYTVIALFAAWGLLEMRLHKNWPLGILTALLLCAASASCILGYISFTKIDSVCLFCMILYSINGVMTILMAVVLFKYRINPVSAFVCDVSALFRSPLTLVAVVGPASAIAGTLMFAIEPYWQHGGWTDLPSLPTGVDNDGSYWIGAEKPILTIVEYSDYQCPFCRRAHRDIRMTAGKFPKEVRLVHRHFPLDNACNINIPHAFHEYACMFSRAAVCAAEQDQFWQMNDALFSIQDSIKAVDVNVEHLAVELGLDRSQFLSCMKQKETPRQIVKDIAEGERLQLEGTPTFFINGQAYEGGISESVITNKLLRIRNNRAKKTAPK